MTQKESNPIADTPLMRQYMKIKAKYPDAVLLFRVGDFYETFGEDAIRASGILGIVLTKRANGAASFVELAGFPHHALDTYLPKLVRAGLRVAICDQLEDPKMTKTIVKRGVTELVTPGVSYNDKILEQKENNFLASIHITDGQFGIAFLDISTGEFYAAQGSPDYADKLFQTFRPNEVILQKGLQRKFTELFGDKFFTTVFDDWAFTLDFAQDILTRHFQTVNLRGFGIHEMPLAIVAAGAALHYLSETHHDRTAHITSVARLEEDKYVWLDRFTIRNLELIYGLNENAKSLLDVFDHTTSPMGARLLRRYLTLPLKERQPVEERHEMTGWFTEQSTLRDEIIAYLKQIGDLERLISKAAVGRINPREILQVKKSLESVGSIKNLLIDASCQPLQRLAHQLNPCEIISSTIGSHIQQDPPVQVNKGGVISEGINHDLDELRTLLTSGKEYLNMVLQREIANTGITSLKISFNNVFGYYLEVTNAHKDKVPAEWTRKQTLVNAERYITEELKEYEQKILGAEEKILAIETDLFNNLVRELAEFVQPIQLDAAILGKIDVLVSFATAATKYNFTKPIMTDGTTLDIKGGRHPVIERLLPSGETYISNDLWLDRDSQQVIILTGPNMSGKSALLRQTALIVLMAQIGSFVPAEKATIGMVDKIFTRVGASDNLSTGESTFMVEMTETASILNNVSDRSLILLDEIGRGTSTYDGISIAWSIAEFLHNHPLFRPKVLFATHYHELNQMTQIFPRIRNFHISIKEIGKKIIFLRKLVEGGSEHSFGIHVARMAGMPQKVVDRAGELLERLEESHNAEVMSKSSDKPRNRGKKGDVGPNYQLSFIQLDDPLLLQIKDEIIDTNIDTLTPVEALMKLNHIKGLLTKKKG